MEPPVHPTPDLPGLALIDPGSANLAGQIIYLDFDGAKDVVYHGPVTVGPFDVPAFRAPGNLAGQEQALILQMLAGLERIFAGSDVNFTTGRPSVDQPCSTIYIGGDDSAFAQYGSFLGLAEQVDAGNICRSDIAVVFPMAASPWAPGPNDDTLTRVIAHEAGHLLGYSHAEFSESFRSPQADLADVAASYALAVTSSHGSVAVSPAKVLYDEGEKVELIPRPDTGYCFAGWTGDAQGEGLRLNLTMDGDKAVTARFDPWTPPIGIPMPEFGIFETYRMYDNPSNRNAELIYQASAEGGFFTHYVDNTDPASTDTANTCGSIAKPRKTIPRGLPAGSVVEVHGGPYPLNPKINGTGTQAQPIFIRGPGSGPRPQITDRTTIGYYESKDGTYIILENFHLYGVGVNAMHQTHHIAVRNNDVEGKITDSRMSGIGVSLTSTSATDAAVSYVVVYNNTIHHFGDYQATGDPDAHGMSVTSGNTLSPLTTRSSSQVWILDNLFYRNSGNGVQINAGNLAFQKDVHHIYLGRNLAYQNKQDALWTKNATDVIFSQNCIWDHTPSDSSLGGALGSQYGPERVWFLFNEISDCSYGIRQSTDQGGGGTGPGTDNYLIGNLIHDIHRPAGEAGGADVWKKGAAIFIASETAEKNIFANTIYNTDSGIQIARRAELHVNGNIFARVAEQHVFFEFPDSPGAGESDIARNLFDNPARILWGRTGDSTAYTLTTFSSAHPGKADGSVEADPVFMEAGNNNFRLQSTSPAIDTDVPSAVQQAYDRFHQLYGLDIRKDIAGRTRAQGNGWDLGAYEYFLSPIVNLAVSETSQNSLTLLWTAPGEQGITGTPTRYDIRYAGSLITEANWGAAIQVQGESRAGGFGQPQSFTITGLNPGITYYVAIKVLDEVGHSSALSNIVSRTTATSGNHAPVLAAIGNQNIDEGQLLIFTALATDSDIPADALTFSLLNAPTGAGIDPASGIFSWTPTEGQGPGSYNLTVRVTDNGTPNLYDEETITVVVNEVNQPPTAIQLSNRSVPEKRPAGITVGTLSTTDPDTGDTFTYSLVTGKGDKNNDLFRISGNTLQTAVSFNYDGMNSYSIRVRTTDSGGLVHERVFTITVISSNQAPTAIQLSNSRVPENQAAGTTVGTLSTTDPDSGDTFIYSLVRGEGGKDNKSFRVSGNTLQTAVSFNYETRSSYSIRVRTTDAGGLTYEQVLTITVTDADESPAVLQVSNSSVPENRSGGVAVGTLSTANSDSGDRFTYGLVAGASSTGSDLNQRLDDRIEPWRNAPT